MAIGAWLGTRVLLVAPPGPFVLVLAFVLLVYLNLDRFDRGGSETVRRLRVQFGIGFGFLAGIFEAVANVAGPMLLIYFMLLGLAPSRIVQTLNLCFSFGKGTQVLTWAASGAMTLAVWTAVGGLVVPSVAALFAGMRLGERIDAATYRAWLRKALCLMALLLIGQFAFSNASHASTPEEQLFRAIEEGRELVAEGLIVRRRADINARNVERETPLHRAIEKGMKALATVLVKAGADLRARTRNGETALHLAALHADPFFARLLLEAGADPKARNDDGESALFWAALSGHLGPVQLLLAHGADPQVADLKGDTALHAAAGGGHVEVVKLLLPSIADAAAKNREGRTARDYARERGYEYIEALLQ
jgi:ankyrin repeat protein